MTNLRISLLGPLSVTIDDRPAEFRTDALRVLLAYLAAHQGVPQRRDTLAALLSPDRNNKDALTYLRNRLTRLRSSLNDDAATLPWFTINRKQITLRAGHDITIDLIQFEQLLSTVESHAHRQLAGCPTCLARLHEVVDLVRGEFLAGLNFDSDIWESWLLGQREHIQQRALDAMTLLRDAQIEGNEWAAVLDVAQRQLLLEPWLETAHRAIMRAHIQLGDRNAALAQYEQCQAVLYQELAVEPEEETTTLFDQLTKDDPQSLIPHSNSPISNNLPLQTNRFFGRKAEKLHLLERLVDPNYRLITLIGTGGIGKTRLAIEVGQQVKSSFPDGVWFVPLDAVKGGDEQIKIAVGEASGLGQPDKQLTGEQVQAILRDKQMLLIFDNCEAVIDELGFIPSWLNRAPQIAFLATSREPLNFRAESIVLLEGLSMGDDEGIGELCAAESMFVEQARMARAGFDLSTENLQQVRHICQLVDGLPLGLALAAAWVRRRSLTQIIDSINQSLDFLSTRMRDVDPRHRSIRAVLETSWDLLGVEEQAILAALSVFPTSFTVEAAEQVTSAQIFNLDLFAEKSLLQQQHEGERYGLHSLVRQFAAEKLQRRAQEVKEAFVDYYFEYARRNQDEYAQLQPEWRNLSSAIMQAHKQAAWQTVIEFVQVLDMPWFRQVRFQEMREGVALALQAAETLGNDDIAAKMLLRIGEVEVESNEYEKAKTYLTEAVDLFSKQENELGAAHATYFLGRVDFEQAQFDQALVLFATIQSTFENAEDMLGKAKALNLIALCHMQKAELGVARANLEKSVSIQRNMPPSAIYTESLRHLARLNIVDGEFTPAEEILAQAEAVSRTLQDAGEYAAVLFERTILHRRQKQPDEALKCGQECLDHAQKLGRQRLEAVVKTQLAILYQAKGNLPHALALFEDSLQIFIYLEDLYEQAYAHYYLFKIHAELNETEQSEQAKQKASQLNAVINDANLRKRLQ